MTANIRALGHRVLAGGVMSLAFAALVAGAVAQTTREVPQTEPDLPPLVELSDAQLERMLERLAAREAVSLLDLNSYVVVVGRAPELPLFGSKADLRSGTAALGMPTHAEMMAVVTPSPVAQAGSADTLGVVTATAFGVLAPLGVKTVAGWLRGTGDDEPEAVRFAGYTRKVRIGGEDGVPSVSFYRRGTQPVVVSMHVPEAYAQGVQLEINGHTLGVFDESVNDVRVPDELLVTDADNGLHLLTVAPASDAVLDRPTEVDLVVVVYATDQ